MSCGRGRIRRVRRRASRRRSAQAAGERLTSPSLDREDFGLRGELRPVGGVQAALLDRSRSGGSRRRSRGSGRSTLVSASCSPASTKSSIWIRLQPARPGRRGVARPRCRAAPAAGPRSRGPPAGTRPGRTAPSAGRCGSKIRKSATAIARVAARPLLVERLVARAAHEDRDPVGVVDRRADVLGRGQQDVVLHVEDAGRLAGPLQVLAEPEELPGLAVRHRPFADAVDELVDPLDLVVELAAVACRRASRAPGPCIQR